MLVYSTVLQRTCTRKHVLKLTRQNVQTKEAEKFLSVSHSHTHTHLEREVKSGLIIKVCQAEFKKRKEKSPNQLDLLVRIIGAVATFEFSEKSSSLFPGLLYKI